MKRISIIARQRIINPHTMKVHNDNGLKALNGYFEDIVVVDEPFNETTFILQYEEKHQELKGWDFQIKEI
ncbi:MAG: hypothetical protein J6Q82_02970 [Clostridia bacterium]|nr:hypothetical protein [Clostridia bacterium]